FQAALAVHEVEQSSALGAQSAAVHRVVGIAFYMDDLGLGVLGLVAQAVHDHAAAHGAVRAGVARLGGARQLEVADLREDRLRREPHHREAGSAEPCRANLEELPAVHVHTCSLWASDSAHMTCTHGRGLAGPCLFTISAFARSQNMNSGSIRGAAPSQI